MSDGPDGGRSAFSAEHSRTDPRGMPESRGVPESRGLAEPAAVLTLSGRSEHIEDEFDALADLFLSDDPADGRAHGSASTTRPGATRMGAARAGVDRPAVEGLIVGHLPVSASSWVKTYAAMRARALGGPVGLIRVLGGTMMIDLVGVDSRGSSEEPEALDSALDRLRARAVGIVVRVDEIVEPEMVGGAIDGLVVLSGADEAAIVGAFRTIKSLVGEESRGIEAPAIRAAIFGAERAEAGEAFERLARSVRHSLSCEITLAGSVERIVSEPSATLYHGAWEGSLGVLLDRLSMGDGESGDREIGSGAAGEQEVGSREIGSGAAGEREVGSREIGSGAAGEREVGSREIGGGAAGEREVGIREIGSGDVPREEAASPEAASAQGGFASLVAGLISCPIRCPDDPDIEIALDREGGIVVVTEDLARGEGVAAWARRHAALIAMAEPRMRLVREGVTLVVRDARCARSLLDTAHRIVLLVEIAGQRGCVPLN